MCDLIIHVITDDKFPEKGIENFNRVLPGRNRAIIVKYDEKFNYLKLNPDVIIKSRQWYFKFSFIKEIRNCSAIVLHHLSPVGLMATLIAQKSKKILWIGWGADYYNQFERKGFQLYGIYTRELIKNYLFRYQVPNPRSPHKSAKFGCPVGFSENGVPGTESSFSTFVLL